ncbi:MAG: hypothetical protein R2865_13155 [Deinococcales bacterium]
MRQRLGVAAAILNKPEVLILDEPASGMDPLSLHLVHRLQQAAQDGAAVFISTHHLDEVNAYCNRGHFRRGSAHVDEVDLGSRGNRYRLKADDVPKTLMILNRQSFIEFAQSRAADVIFELGDDKALGEIAHLLSQENIRTLELSPDHFDLRAYIIKSALTTQSGQDAQNGEKACFCSF